MNRRTAINVACPSCKAAAEKPCTWYAGDTTADSYGAPRIGRFHRERVIAAGKATREINAKARAAAALPIAKITEQCPAHPGEFAENDDGTHECLAEEMRCAYCGARLAPYPCHSCGKFLTARRMHDAGSGAMPHHCEDCTP